MARQNTLRKPRAKRFDLVRKANLLGCDPSHLAKVLKGQRQSASLLIRLEKLMETEQTAKPKQPQN